MEKTEVRVVIKYFQLKKMSPTEIHADLQNTLGQSAPSYDVVKKWCREFKCGRQSCEDEHGAGPSKTVSTPENINRIHDLVMNDRRLTIRRIAELTDIGHTTVDNILIKEL